MARSAAVVHIVRRIRHDAPFHRLFDHVRAEPYPVLLDSAGGAPRLARASFLAWSPRLVVRATREASVDARGRRHGRVVVARATGEREEARADVFAVLRAQLAEERPRARAASPVAIPHAIGYFGYEVGQMLERLPLHPSHGSEPALPDAHFGFYDTVLAHVHETRETWASVLGRGADDESAREEAAHTLAMIEARFAEVTAPKAPSVARGATVFAPRMIGEAEYMAQVDAVRERIFAGDIFQACLTHRAEVPFTDDPWTLYRALRDASPAPFAAFMPLPEGAVVSASPERFLRLDGARRIESRPIKGTRPRGATPTEDEALAHDLATAAKDAAENTMIVDLVRSDLGRVAAVGSVRVPELRVVERYATVHQLVSTVTATLAEGLDAVDLVQAAFPGGSMTGAPKIEATNVTTALEATERGVYSGALGYFDLEGGMDLSIVIRTVVVRDGVATIGTGGAVVADSDPRAEYQETLDKLRAPLAALATLARGAP
ncbi:MAG: aminodeoxychorismate synthase component I [Polyangiaceae bacterium]